MSKDNESCRHAPATGGTPRTDAVAYDSGLRLEGETEYDIDEVVSADFARQLERELSARQQASPATGGLVERLRKRAKLIRENTIEKINPGLMEEAANELSARPEASGVAGPVSPSRMAALEEGYWHATGVNPSEHFDDDSCATPMTERDIVEQGKLTGRIIYDLSARQQAVVVDGVPVAEIEAEIAHIEENGASVRAISGGENEGRCRELCAMYLREFLTGLRLNKKLASVANLTADIKESTDRLTALSYRQQGVSVPREPTREMMRAFWQAGPYPENPFVDGYKAMLAAAPQSTAPEESIACPECGCFDRTKQVRTHSAYCSLRPAAPVAEPNQPNAATQPSTATLNSAPSQEGVGQGEAALAAPLTREEVNDLCERLCYFAANNCQLDASKTHWRQKIEKLRDMALAHLERSGG